MNTYKASVAVIALAVISYAAPGAADVVAIDGHVVSLQASYMPGEFTFGLDGVGNSSCPASWFYWYSNPTNPDRTKAEYATVLAAFLSGAKIHAIYDTASVGSKPGANCVFSYLYIIPNSP